MFACDFTPQTARLEDVPIFNIQKLLRDKRRTRSKTLSRFQEICIGRVGYNMIDH